MLPASPLSLTVSWSCTLCTCCHVAFSQVSTPPGLPAGWQASASSFRFHGSLVTGPALTPHCWCPAHGGWRLLSSPVLATLRDLPMYLNKTLLFNPKVSWAWLPPAYTLLLTTLPTSPDRSEASSDCSSYLLGSCFQLPGSFSRVFHSFQFLAVHVLPVLC